MGNSGTEINWPELVFSETFIASIDKLANRRFGGGAIAEEAATHVIEALSADDWQKCRSFQGKSKPTTFLYTLASHAIEEFSRKRFGRPRPPTWLEQMGDIWVKVWRSLCLERQMLPAIVDRFSALAERESVCVEQTAKVIKARVTNCGETSMDSMDVEDIDALSDAMQANESNHDDPPSQTNPFYTELLAMVKAVVDDKVCCDSFSTENINKINNLTADLAASLDAVKASLRLTDEERVMLKMIYVEGLSKTATSKALGLPAHQAGRIINSVLGRISECLTTHDIDLEGVLELV